MNSILMQVSNLVRRPRLFATVLVALCLSAMPAIAQLIANGTYTITGKNSGQVVDVYSNSTAEGGLIDQWDSNGGNNQKWYLNNLGNNYIDLINVNSGWRSKLPVNRRLREIRISINGHTTAATIRNGTL